MPLPMRILLATRNGAPYLQPQLDSLLAQTHDDWALLAADDGSQDGTYGQLARFAATHPQRMAHLGPGPERGAAANFLSLAARAVEQTPGVALAFCDQDDVWHPEKLARANAWLEAHGAGQGAILAWSCRTLLTDSELRHIGESRVFPRPPAFGNALVQNILAGNTIVLSPAAAKALAHSVRPALAAGVPYHDWWAYQLISGMGGTIMQDAAPLVMYRQHADNSLGHHGPVRGRLHRLSLVAKRDYASWISANLTALADSAVSLTPEHRHVLRLFARLRRKEGRVLAAALPRLGLHRQTAQGDRMLRVMALSGRL